MRHASPRSGRHSRPSPPQTPTSSHSESRKARRRFAAVVLAMVGIAGLGIASAAQLNLSGTPISAGSTIIASCQTSGTITVTFPTTWVAPNYQVSSVRFSNVTAGCGGKAYRMQLLNTSGVALGTEVTGASLTVTGNVATIAVGSQLASAVGGVALVIEG